LTSTAPWPSCGWQSSGRLGRWSRPWLSRCRPPPSSGMHRSPSPTPSSSPGWVQTAPSSTAPCRPGSTSRRSSPGPDLTSGELPEETGDPALPLGKGAAESGSHPPHLGAPSEGPPMSAPSTRTTGIALAAIGSALLANGAWFAPILLSMDPSAKLSEYGGQLPFRLYYYGYLATLVAFVLLVPSFGRLRGRTGRTLPRWLPGLLVIMTVLQIATVYTQAFV